MQQSLEQKLKAIKPRTQLITEVDSGTISFQLGSDGVWLRFDCDCADALPYCQAQCCALIGTVVFPDEIIDKLVPETGVELDNKSRWVMKRESDGFCECLDRQTRTCNIYENRPQTCRQFHCTRGAEQRGWKQTNYVHRQAGEY